MSAWVHVLMFSNLCNSLSFGNNKTQHYTETTDISRRCGAWGLRKVIKNICISLECYVVLTTRNNLQCCLISSFHNVTSIATNTFCCLFVRIFSSEAYHAGFSLKTMQKLLVWTDLLFNCGIHVQFVCYYPDRFFTNDCIISFKTFWA